MKARRRVIGLHAAEAALDHGADKILAVFIDSQRNDSRLMVLVERLAALGIKTQPTQRLRLEQMAEGTPHQGIILEVLAPDEWGENELRDALEAQQGMPFFLVLDHVQDPHNFGACLRTADAAGVNGVIVTKDQSVGITPVVAKVASGAAETMPIYRVTNLARTLKLLKEAGLWVFGAAGEAHKTAYEMDFNVPMALVMGAEAKGLRRLTRENCDDLMRLPMSGTVESLNVSVAAGILMYEVVRQRVSTSVS